MPSDFSVGDRDKASDSRTCPPPSLGSHMHGGGMGLSAGRGDIATPEPARRLAGLFLTQGQGTLAVGRPPAPRPARAQAREQGRHPY